MSAPQPSTHALEHVAQYLAARLGEIAVHHLCARTYRFGVGVCNICRSSWPCYTYTTATEEGDF